MRRFLSLLMVIGLLLTTATACMPIQSIDTTFDLKADETWTVGFEITVTKDIVNLLTSQMDNMKDQWQAYQEQGISISMGEVQDTEDGNSLLPIIATGKGFELLNNELFSGNPIVVVDPQNPDQYLFTFNAGLLGQLDLAGALSSTVTLNAGRIIETNGEKVDNNTIVWNNTSGEMTATFSKSPDLTVLWYSLGGVGGAAVLGGGVFAIVRRRKPRAKSADAGVNYTPGFVMPSADSDPNLSYTAPATETRSCAGCGGPLPAGASFCPACGQKNQ